MAESKPKCLIIGAGPSGLVTLRHVKEVADVKCVDAKDQVGGLWLYTDVTEQNHPDLENDVYYKYNNHLHDSIYKELLANLPIQFMTFKDFPHKKGTPTFMLREHFFDYLLSYTKHFHLYKNIKLGTYVMSVRLTNGLTEEEKKEWRVKENRKFVVKYCQKTDESHVSYEEFDYVIVCNGHNSYPVIPKIEGDEEFEGEKIPVHCFRDYNIPDFKEKDILIIGARFSAIDLMTHFLYSPYISQDYVGKIYIAGSVEALEKSTDFKDLYEKDKVVLKHGRVKRLGKNEVTFADGSTAKVDMVWYACGYRFRFPFLETPDKLIDWSLDVHEGKYWGPLFARIFAIRETNLMFTGNHDVTIVTQLVMEKQAIVAKKYIGGQVDLPTEEDMYKSLEQDLEEHRKLDLPIKKFFHLQTNITDWDYIDQLKGLAKMESNQLFDETLKEMGQIAVDYNISGNILSYHQYDFNSKVPDGLRSTSEFF